MRQEQYGVRRQRRATHPYVLYVRTELQVKRRSPCCVSSHPHAKRQMTRSVRRLPHVEQLPPFCVWLHLHAMRQTTHCVRPMRSARRRTPLYVKQGRRATRRLPHCVGLRPRAMRQLPSGVRAPRRVTHLFACCARLHLHATSDAGAASGDAPGGPPGSFEHERDRPICRPRRHARPLGAVPPLEGGIGPPGAAGRGRRQCDLRPAWPPRAALAGGSGGRRAVPRAGRPRPGDAAAPSPPLPRCGGSVDVAPAPLRGGRGGAYKYFLRRTDGPTGPEGAAANPENRIL